MADPDEEEIIRYVFTYYAHLLTFQEEAAYKSIFAEEKARNVEGSRLAEMMRKHWVSSDPAVRALLAKGEARFKRDVVRRLLEEHPDEIFFNRCPQCQALTRTPRAKQCPQCFFDWHEEV